MRREEAIFLKVSDLLALCRGRLMRDFGMRDECAQRLMRQIMLAAVPHDHWIERDVVGRKSTAKERNPSRQTFSWPAARLRAIKSDIVANLENDALGIATVAARHGVTSRYLH